MRSIRDFGTPWNYSQSFTATYKAPFSKIAVLDFLNGNVSYNATYRWDRGADVADAVVGNSIANNVVWNLDSKINFETLYNKCKYLKEVNKRFSNSSRGNRSQKERKPRKFQRTYQLSDSVVAVKHNLRSKKVKVSATTLDGKPFPIKTKVVDDNNLQIITTGKQSVKLVVTEDLTKEVNV